MSDYLLAREELDGHHAQLWIVREGTALTLCGLETAFTRLSRKSGIAIHPHLLRHTFATLWLRNGGDSIMLQRLLGHTTLQMTSRYVQAVGCEDARKSHERFGPIDNIGKTVQN